MSKGIRWTDGEDGIRVEEVERTDAEIAQLEQREMRNRLAIVELDELLTSAPSNPIEFAHWYLNDEKRPHSEE